MTAKNKETIQNDGELTMKESIMGHPQKSTKHPNLQNQHAPTRKHILSQQLRTFASR
jgi:hypothetical protein